MRNPLSPQRRRVTLVNLLLVVALAATGLWAYKKVNGDNGASASTARTTAVRLTDVSSTVSATGTVTDPSEVGVNFSSSGTLTSVKVRLGQQVRKGQLLATIDSTSLQNAYRQAAASLAQAKAGLTSAKANVVQSGNSVTQAQAAVPQAQANVTQAQYSATQAHAALQPDSSAMLQAQQSLLQAQVSFNNGLLADTQTAQQLASLKQAWDDAVAKVTSLQSVNNVNSQKYDQSVTGAYNTMNADYTAYLQAATNYANYVTANASTLNQTSGSQGVCALINPGSATDTATAILNTCTTLQSKTTQAYAQWTNDSTNYNIQVGSRTNSLTSDSSALASAVNAASQAANAYANAVATQSANGDLNAKINVQALKLAQAKYNDAVTNLQNTANQADNAVVSAQNAVKQAQFSVVSAKNGVVNSRNSVGSAQSSVQIAQANLASAALNLAGARLLAPVAGEVASISSSVGQTVSSSSGTGSSSATSGSSGGSSISGFIVLTGVSALRVQASVTEGDAGNVKVGQIATFSFDALSGASATGKVSWVDLIATTSSGVASYGVTLDMDTVPAGLKPGMSASVTITTASAGNVLAVPSTSVTSAGTRSFVTVVTTDGNGKQTQTRTPVTVGLKGDSMTEISSGLKAGDEVILSTTTTSASSSGFPTGGVPGADFGGGGSGLGLLRRATQG